MLQGWLKQQRLLKSSVDVLMQYAFLLGGLVFLGVVVVVVLCGFVLGFYFRTQLSLDKRTITCLLL